MDNDSHKIYIPKPIQFPLIWTLSLSIIGIAIQSFASHSFSFQTISNFFTTNYSNWISSFGNFTALTSYSSTEELAISILSKWYYFLLTGGFISLIWGIISWLIHLELKIPAKTQTTPIVN